MGETPVLTVSGDGFDSSAAVSLARPDVALATWTAVASPCTGCSLTRLADGRVLALGNAGASVNAWIFNPSSASWTSAAHMLLARQAPDAVLLQDGRVLALGGTTSTSTFVDPELYDPVADAWSFAGTMLAPRSGRTATRLPDGRVLVVGGLDPNSNPTADAEIYDPAANSWSAAAPDLGPVSDHRAVLLSNGRVLVAGGPAVSTSPAANVYDPAANAWSPTGRMNAVRSGLVLLALPDGRALAEGGGPASAEVYDPANGQWSPTGAIDASYSFGVDLYGSPLVFGANGSARLYDLQANAWTSAPARASTGDDQAVDLGDGRLLLNGGVNALSQTVSSVLSAPASTLTAASVSLIDTQHLTANFSLAGAPAGLWDLVLTQSGGSSARLTQAFLVRPTPPPSTVVNLSVQTTGYRSHSIGWTAPGDKGDQGQALSYDLRYATFPITDANFASAPPVPGVQPPLPAGSATNLAVSGLDSSVTLYFALKTTSHEGFVSALSNVAVAQPIDSTVSIDPDGKLWQLDYTHGFTSISRYSASGEQRARITASFASFSRTIAFDDLSNAYAVYTPTATDQPPFATVYEVSPDGLLISSSSFYDKSGQPAAFNQVASLQHAVAAASDGNALWIAGAYNGTATLWKADSSGLALAGLSSGISAQAVLSLGDGSVWMTGGDGELTLWRYDTASGAMSRYVWNNSLGGSGSSGQGLLEDQDGSVWIAGWANAASSRTVAALWQWNGSSIALVAVDSTSANSQALGIELDPAGRFWLAGRSHDASGTASLSLWQYPVTGGSDLLLEEDHPDYPQPPAFHTDHALAFAHGELDFASGPQPLGMRSRTLHLGDIAGTLHYPTGFQGGNVAFFLSPTPDFAYDTISFGLVPAPSSGTVFNYSLASFPAPATYYIAAAYDLSGSIAANGNPGPTDPVGLSFSPINLIANSVAQAADITLTPDSQPPSVAITAPADASTTTVELFAISGTAADDAAVSQLKFGLQRLSDGAWWDQNVASFTASQTPIINNSVVLSGDAQHLSWTANTYDIVPFLQASSSFTVIAQAADLSGQTAQASASVVIQSSAAFPVVSTSSFAYSLALARAPDGAFWSVNLDTEAPTISLRRFDSQGIALSSITLPGADSQGSFAVAFDAAGDAWVGGTSSTSPGQPLALAVWKVAPDASAILASNSYSDPFAQGSIYDGRIAVDSAGNAWLSGAEQTAANASFRFGLWKFNPDGSLAGTPFYYQRSGSNLDGGFDTTVAPDGSIWSAGLSSNPASGRLDLALWKFSSTGQLQSGFPVFGPELTSTPNDSDVSLKLDANSRPWVAAHMTYPAAPNLSDLALFHFDASGVVISSTLWHAADQSPLKPKALALDSSGNPWVVGTDSTTPVLWKFSAAADIAPGFPKADSARFDPEALALDLAGTPWVVEQAAPEVFDGTIPVAGALGPSPLASAAPNSVSGSISYAASFNPGDTVSLVVSTDGFHGNPLFFQFVSTGGTSLPFSASLLAPATVQLVAFVGSNPNTLTPADPIGSYNHFQPLFLSTSAALSGLDFTLALDSQPPTSAFGVVDGSTLTALASIAGTTTDNAAARGILLLAAHDLTSDRWWNPDTEDWVPSTAPAYYQRNSSTSGNPDHVSWAVSASADQLIGDSSFGGFSDFLSTGHAVTLLAKAVDLVGNIQPAPTVTSFIWEGAVGAVGPPSASPLYVTAVSSASASFSWQAAGEHQNIGIPLAYDLRYATFPVTDAAFASASAAAGLPAPLQANSSVTFTLSGLNPGSYYYAALKTTNHEGGISPLSNIVSIHTSGTPPPPSTVSDLSFTQVSGSSLTVSWSAPYSGAGLTAYDLRFATFPITDADFLAASTVAAPAPTAAGTLQSASIFSAEPALFVALKSTDANGATSALSNVAALVRSTVSIDGAPELTFFAGSPVSQVYLSTDSVAAAPVIASAAAQGLSRVSSIYDLGPEGGTFAPPANLSIRYSTAALASLGLSTADVHLYEFFPSSGLVAVSSQTVDPVARSYAAPITTLASRFALFGAIPVSAPSLVSLAVAPSSASLLTGETLQFAAVGAFSDGSTATVTASWASDAPSVATVSASGLVSALSSGTVHLTALSGAASGSALVVVSTTAPDAVSDLAFAQVAGSSLTVSWTAPASGLPLAGYDLRAATFTIDDANFLSATPLAVPAPGTAGTLQTASFPAPGPDVFVALVSSDSGGNRASISNVAALVRSGVVDGGPELTFFAGSPVSATFVSTDSALGLAVLSSATAAELVQAGSIYDLGPEGGTFAPPASLTIRYSSETFASLGLSTAEVHLYEFFPSSGLIAVSSQTVDPLTHAYSAPISLLASRFALFADPMLPPRTSLAVGSPSFSSATLYAAASTPLSLSAVDDLLRVGDGAGRGVAATYVAVDTTAFSPYSSSFSIPSEGLHSISFYSVDLNGNTEVARSSAVAVDLTAPVSLFEVLGSSAIDSQGGLIVSTATPLAFSASDPVSNGVASGLGAISFSIDADTAAAYAAPFTLAAGTHTLRFSAADHVGNQEALRSVSLSVQNLPLDVLPPRSALAVGSPSVSSPTVVVSTLTPLSLSAVDDAIAVGDGAG
ncbi:MAG: Ig-like domain-containing protein, partial [Elusimicrobia bacterium]|nr:Ig-like domain-containing protein [Elusimicrobiota bacterium]